MKRVISLTSIPPRFSYLGPSLESLLAQGADQVRLNIPMRYGRFSDWDGALPKVPAGVHIARCDHDYGPATKVLPTAHDLAGTETQILFCDDDLIVAPGWAERLFRLQAARPDMAVTGYVRGAQGYVPNAVTPLRRPAAWQVPVRWDVPYRLGRLRAKLLGGPNPRRRPFVIPGYGEVFFGAGGVVVRPDFFDAVSMDVPPEVWMVDDVWLSAQMARKSIPIYCPFRHPQPQAQEQSDVAALLDLEVDGLGRQDLNRQAAVYCRDRFGIWAG